MTSGVLHVRLTSYILHSVRAHVRSLRKTAAARAAVVLPVVYVAYTVHFRRSTRLSSRVISYVTFPTFVTVSIYSARFDTLRSYELLIHFYLRVINLAILAIRPFFAKISTR